MASPHPELVEHISQIAWESSSEGGIFWFNLRWYEYVGDFQAKSRAEIIAAIMHPDDTAEVAQSFEVAVRTKSYWRCKYRLRRHDGMFRWFLGEAFPMKAADGSIEYWAGSATDINILVEVEAGLNKLIDSRIAEIGKIAAETVQALKGSTP